MIKNNKMFKVFWNGRFGFLNVFITFPIIFVEPIVLVYYYGFCLFLTIYAVEYSRLK